jgi:hypothetical protein
MAVSHQFHGRAAGVTAIQQPAQIAHSDAQGGPGAAAEQTLVLRPGSPVGLFVSQAQSLILQSAALGPCGRAMMTMNQIELEKIKM